MTPAKHPRSDTPGAWVFVTDPPPEPWQSRAIPVYLVPLLPNEAGLIFGDAQPQIGPEDEALLAVLAGGGPVAAIARELGITLRSAQRRLARLRRRFNVSSTAELAALAASRGFGEWHKHTPSDVAGEQVPDDEL